MKDEVYHCKKIKIKGIELGLEDDANIIRDCDDVPPAGVDPSQHSLLPVVQLEPGVELAQWRQAVAHLYELQASEVWFQQHNFFCLVY